MTENGPGTVICTWSPGFLRGWGVMITWAQESENNLDKTETFSQEKETTENTFVVLHGLQKEREEESTDKEDRIVQTTFWSVYGNQWTLVIVNNHFWNYAIERFRAFKTWY